MNRLRTLEDERAYRAHKAARPADAPCALCTEGETVAEFMHWRVIPNRFPYSRIAARHDLLITKRHCTERELTEDERGELLNIKDDYCDNQYDNIIESTHHKKSIPEHYHLHLLEIQDISDHA